MSVETLAQWIRTANRVAYLAGAGLSVASGIRPYRKAPNAVWAEYVMEWGTLQKFLEDPSAWWLRFWLQGHADLFKPVEPNDGHRALAALCRGSPSATLVTQNIDGLSRRAGHPEEQLIEIHGRHDRFICAGGSRCEGVRLPAEQVDLSGLEEGDHPVCSRCGAPMRPLVLLFDELYDSHPAYQAGRARRALVQADVVVFVGTSFSVGITELALEAARMSGAKVANLNLDAIPPRSGVSALELTGKSEELLPALAGELSASG